MGAHSSSLLRLRPVVRGCVLLLAVTWAVANAAVAQATGQVPDPSPSVSSPGPDAYRAPAAPAATPRTQAPAPASTQPPVGTVVRTTVVRAPVHHPAARPKKPKPAVTHKAAVEPVRLPTHPLPGLEARIAAALADEPQQRVSRALALAVALLVLLSAAFVAGAAREVAR